ncbi:DUF6527 family protein [Mesorhizobium hunchu]|uniref:DUF6527 family protein n=1 Tax=Mesorhizobium hunchu TaxID=3157708 RepID=UPI003CCD63F1
MKRLIAYLRRLWLRFRRRHEIASIVQVSSRSELPTRLGTSLYLVGDPPKWAVLKCPCGCGDTIDVNLMKARSPAWQLSVVNGKASFHPSLWMPKDKCGAHFWIRNGKITWV